MRAVSDASTTLRNIRLIAFADSASLYVGNDGDWLRLVWLRDSKARLNPSIELPRTEREPVDDGDLWAAARRIIAKVAP
jgi:hypothetical protein